jgi:uncharacterized membrane protein
MLDVLLKRPQSKKTNGQTVKRGYRVDKPIKSLIKSLSWRVVGTIDTMIISYFITGKMTVAVSIGGVEVITKTILYYFHERLWTHIHRIRIGILRKRVISNGFEFEKIEA